MKIKTSELKVEDLTLDWAVAKCLGVPVHLPDLRREWWDLGSVFFRASTDDFEASRIIDRFNKEQAAAIDDRLMISTGRGGTDEHNFWCASIGLSDERMYGPTRIVAALRCYVNFKLGPEVEVPDELVADLVAQQSAKSDEVQAPKGAEPQITNKWHFIQHYSPYYDFSKELYSLPDKGNTSVDMRLSFDEDYKTCYYTILLHNNDGSEHECGKSHHVPWDTGLAMLAADDVEVPAALMAQSSQAGQGNAHDLESVQQPIERPRG
jgi:hypothetical protein